MPRAREKRQIDRTLSQCIAFSRSRGSPTPALPSWEALALPRGVSPRGFRRWRACPHSARSAQVPHQRASVKSQITGILCRSDRPVRILRAPIRGNRGKFADDQPLDVGTRGLFVFRVGAHVSNVGIRQAHHLSGITRVGEHFLISGEARVKYDFPAAASLAPAARPLKIRPSSSASVAVLSVFSRQRSLLMRKTIILSKRPKPKSYRSGPSANRQTLLCRR